VGLLSLVACETPATAVDDLTPTVVAPATTNATATAPPTPPPIATDPPAPVDTVGPPPSPTSIQTSTPIAPTVTPTSTGPPPTFTPPPPPPQVEGEHLVWPRPVPLTSPLWTDKSYPYGSTRGGMLRPHTGVEFGVDTGTPVLAVAPGTVVAAGSDAQMAYGPQTDFYGNLVIVESEGDSPVFTLYGHLSAVNVAVGQTVAASDLLGLSGATGVADGPHLHFEVRVGENAYSATRNPLLWLAPLPQTGVVAGRVVSPAGELLHEAPVTLRRVDGPAPYTATTSYAQGEPNSDIDENFAVDDVVPGFYEVEVDTGRRTFTAELWVYPGRVNWVELVVGP
jgi:murein DD-endopeptidase MepM/ murein hydrolase activator NlpD